MDGNKKSRTRLIGKDVILSSLLAGTLILFYTKISMLSQDFDNFETISYQKKEPVMKFGFDINEKFIDTKKINTGDVLSTILNYEGLSIEKIAQLEEKVKDVSPSFLKLKSGKNLHFVRNEKCEEPFAVVYEPTPFEYIVFNLNDDIGVKLIEKQETTCIEIASGKIKSSLWNALVKEHVDTRIIDKMEDALASNIDFYHTKVGDEFKLVYEKRYVDDKCLGIGRLLGINYKNGDDDFFAYYYDRNGYEGFYDEKGRPCKAGFLKSPVKNVRISSNFNRSRFHPILRRTIPHLGTDYAAPYGTPIMSVADGVVEAAAYTGGNGRYVKVKHDNTYQTQYLHMQAFARGIRKGTRVKQGQTIGYVGSTGLATGPHVCFRFWKNGAQVNHQRNIFAPPKPMNSKELPYYNEYKDGIKTMLNSIEGYTTQYAQNKNKP